MIPLSLRLKNFMSYRQLEPPLSFEGFQMACLCGRNGEGKSALFDAITWSLWGKARGVDDRGTGSDELITEGENQMQVDFSFQLEKNIYRVIRSRDRKKQTTRLEFQIQNNGQFSPLTGNSIRETQEKLNQTLRLDYRTFVNSAFILQGKADSFLSLKPIERKEILADILNLSIYDQLEDKAREARRDQEKKLAAVQMEIALHEKEIDREADFQREADLIENELAEIREELSRKEKKLESLKLEQAKIDGQQKLLQELEKRSEQTAKELSRLESELTEDRIALERSRHYLKKSAEVLEGYQQLTTLRRQEEELAQKAVLFQALQDRLHQSENEIVSKTSQLETEIKNLEQLKATLKSEAETETRLQARQRELQAEIKKFDELERKRDELREAYQQHQAEIARLKGQIEQGKEKLDAAREKLTLLEKEVKPNCPLCEQELNAGDRAKLIDSFQREIASEQQKIEQNQARLDRLRQAMEKVEAKGKEFAEKIETKPDKVNSLAEVNSKLHQLQANREKSKEVESQLEKITAMLASQSYAKEAFSEKNRIKRELSFLDFQPGLYEQVRLRIKEKEHLEQEKAKLEQTKAEADKLAKEIKVLETQLREKRNQLKTDQLQIEKLKAEISESIREPDLFETVVKESEADYRQVKQKENELFSQRAVLKVKLKSCQEAKKRLAALLSEQENILKEIAIFSELAVAFSKKGIQALIIENVVPEIEEEANKILARLTGGKMVLGFVTQKNQKTGGVIETLDLTVSDEQGNMRKYELFSGGESFRINFSVRIALSKLLAKRAGARLETLVIDEGFGTQDSEGKEKLIEAFSAIKNDFQKILVITHLDDLKELFPARIEVAKKAGIGSTAVVV